MDRRAFLARSGLGLLGDRHLLEILPAQHFLNR